MSTAEEPARSGAGALPWHRHLVNRFEALLQEIDPTVALHYWDWTTDPRRTPNAAGGRLVLDWLQD